MMGAREAEAEELRDLVERLAGGVVARLAHQEYVNGRPRVIERRVAAGHHERQERMLGGIVGRNAA